MKVRRKSRLLGLGIAGLLAILALLFLRSRGWNSHAIACRGGEAFQHFPVIETPVYLQRDSAWEADRMHEHVRVRMAVQAFGVVQIHSAENQFAPFNQTVHVVADTHVNHGGTLSGNCVE